MTRAYIPYWTRITAVATTLGAYATAQEPVPEPAAATEPAIGVEPAPAEPSAPPVEPSPTTAGPETPPAAPAQPTPPPPQIYVEQPMPEPPMARNRHYHDGFYLRLGVGAGYLAARSTIDNVFDNRAATMSIGGLGAMFDLAVGGTPAPGLVVGGALKVQEAFEPSVEISDPSGTTIDADANNGSLGFLMIGPMIDGFPDPDGGLHVGGSLGFASLGLRDGDRDAAAGIGLSAWVGYLWWVSSQWSIGGSLHGTLAFTGRDVGGRDASENIRSLGLTFTALYH
jgi:hypothetical protein